MRTVFCMAILVIGVGSADALTVRLLNAGQGGPPEIEYVNGSSSPLEFVLELANETISDTPPILTWQLELGLSGVASAVGELEFSSVAAPDGSIFGNDPGPISLTDLPTNEMVVTDADPSPEFTGVIIPAESSAPIAKLTLLPSSDAEGVFSFSMAAFDVDDIDHTSYWLDAVGFQPIPFDNAVTTSQRIELATIRIVRSQPLDGDFNNDLVVDAADYTVWRNGLGSIYTEDDYDVWKQHFGETKLGVNNQTPVPELSSGSLCVIALVIGFAHCRPRHPAMNVSE